MNTFTFPLPDCPQDHQFYRRKANPFSFSKKPKTPEEILNLARQCLFYWLHKLLMVTHISADPRHFNVYMPYCVVPIIRGPIPEEMMWYIWTLSAQYDCAIAVPAFTIYHLLLITGIEGLSLTEEEASSSQNTIQEDLNQFQENFFASSVMFPTPSLSQDSDPWGGPLSQNPYDYEEETDARIYPILSSPTHVDARINDDEENLYCQQSDDDSLPPHMEHDDFADHEPIIK
ncbi:hypothetical protein PIB30_008296 [Stylosanthes scabra]|uniref:Uncharacterized protein n=1 Tax=Stylosanthes scabra TaxID=79078 RepID=A0ABU6S4B5_9FABA|nr:hypothetical protein [Stylosanthes scabra]